MSDPIMKFPLGKTTMTESLLEWMNDGDGMDRLRFLFESLARHARGDWGEGSHGESRAANDEALERGAGRLYSAYKVPEQVRADAPYDFVWIITEADRTTTTLLWPGDY